MDLKDFPPMLPNARPLPFDLPGWIYEIKHHGLRVTARFGDGECKLRTRNGADATAWFPEVAHSLTAVNGGPFIVDGEMCVFDGLGRSNFALLQDRARRRRSYEDAEPVSYAVFDLLVDGGTDITAAPLSARKVLLSTLLAAPRDAIFPVSHFSTDTERLFNRVVLDLGMQGLVAKRLDSPYQCGVRSLHWVIMKRPRALSAERLKQTRTD